MGELRAQAGLDVLAFPALDGLRVRCAVTTRAGGVSDGAYSSLNLGLHVGDDPQRVVENRRRALAVLGAGLDDAVFCAQSHGRAVYLATAADGGRGARSQDDAVPASDALVTATPGLTLVVLVADCVPVVLVDPHAGVVAAVHAGWRGTVAGVCAAAVERMRRLGADPARVVACLGPAVAPSRYEVGPEVARAAQSCFGGQTPDVLTPAGGRWLFDLWTANALVLRSAGVPAASVHVAAEPTGGGGPFYSDRDARPCGRFGLLVRLER